MRRRQVLALCGASVAGLAGCSATPSGDESAPAADGTATPADDGTATPASTETATPTAAPATELSVSFDALQPGFVSLNVDWYGIVSDDGSQYLFVNVSVVSGPSPPLSELVFRFDGDEHSPRMPDEDPEVHRENESDTLEWVLFRLPETGDASDAALVWPGGEWHPDEQLRARLAAPLPPLSLEAWTVPEAVPVGDTVAFEFAVRNRGDLPGRFLAVINAEGWAPHRPVAVVSRQIPPGETASWEVAGEKLELFDDALAQEVGDGDPDVTYELTWSGPGRDSTVSVVEG